MPRSGQNEMRPKRGMPLRVRLTKGFGLILRDSSGSCVQLDPKRTGNLEDGGKTRIPVGA